MKPTTVGLLVGLAAAAAAIGWAIVTLTEALFGRLLPVPWAAALAMWVIAAAMFMWAWVARPRLRREPGSPRLDPISAARTAALALAGSRTGAVFMGLYAGFALGLVPLRDVPAGSQAMWASLGAAAGALALTGVSWWLESMCRIKGDDDDAAGAPGSTDGGAVGRA